MEASQTLNKILKLAQDHNSDEKLQSFCKLKLEKVIDDLPQIILRNVGRKILDCIFKGLPDIACPIKIKVLDMIFKTMRKEEISLTHCADLISRVCLELPKMPVEHLVRWSSSCVQCVIEDSDVNMIWRDILPECLNVVSTYDAVTTSGTEMSGMEFKVQCIHTLCQCNWTERQLVQLAAMFKDFQMHNKNSPWPEHKQVVNKLCTNILDVPPETLPPLVHQLLILCKLYNAEIVLSHLSNYFNIQLYSKLEPPPHDTESTTMDLDDIVQYSPDELSRCLSTCLYHITQGKADPELIRKHIKQWPSTQLLRAPFIIDLALAVSNKGSDYKSVCLDVIKSAIELRILDELRSKESAWVRSVLPPDVDVVNVLKVLTTESGNHRQITVLGLINLAFSLLSVSRTKPTASSCWSHGKLILVRLSSAQPETASHILGQLSDRLFSDQNLQQYTDCLHVLCKLTPVSIERCPKLITILENCQPLGSYEHSGKTYEAVSPLISFSTRVRDTLVMVCRKGLYSRDAAHRCLALSGFLTVLRYVKLSKKSVSSQTSSADDYGGHSYLTQITVDMHATSQGSQVTSRMRNETICLEVISILRRCLSQDAAVKQLLYTDLYNCVKEKHVLYEPILELFYEHLTKYMPEEGGTGLSLDLCVQEKATAAILTEPIGRLIYIIAQFLQATDDNYAEDMFGSQNETYMRNKLMEITEKLCKIDFQSFVNMEEIGLMDITTESKAKLLKVQQILQCYEAFIGHHIMQWTQFNTNAASVYKLYKASNELLENAKATPKSKKVGTSQTKDTQKSPKKTQKSPKQTLKQGAKASKTKSVSQTDKSDKSKSSTQSSTKSQKSQKSPQTTNAPVKVSNLVKERVGPFKALPCLWDINLCIRVLDLLYREEVSWSSVEQRNYIRSKRDFHIFALRNIQSVLENTDKRSKVQMMQIANILYKRCISRFRDMCDFDDRTTLACLELFKLSLIMLLSPNFSLKIDSVLTGITDITDKPASASLADILQKIYTALTILESEAAEEDLDMVRKKILVTLMQITSVLLEAPVLACNTLNEVILKVEEYITISKQVEALPLLSALLTASSRDQREATLLPQLLVKLSAELGDIDEDESSSNEESSSEFPTIDSRTGHTVLSQVCVHLSSRFKFAEHLLSRARDLSNALANSVPSHQKRIDKELKELYKTIVIEFCQLARWTSKCAQLRCCIGGGSDKVISNCVRLYSLLAMLIKQLDPTMATFLRLERLLKYTGKELSSVIDKLIIYLESSQQQSKASKVLRDTKLIPRLVFEAEQFSKRVILLGVKANLNFQQYLSLGTARDFKIKAPILKQVLDIREPEEEEMDVDDNISEAPTDIIEMRGHVEEDYEDEGPTPKKNKKS